MSQVSMPVRVMLVLAVLFMAAWMTVLKPKDEVVAPATPAAPATAQSAPGQTVNSATTAATSADARNAQADAAADGLTGQSSVPATTAAAPSTAAPAAQPDTAPAPGASDAAKAGEEGGLPLKLLRGIADRKVMVLLFWNPRAADDRAVRRELKGIGAHKDKGKVLVHVAHVKRVSKYQQITRGAQVDQSPTIVVVDGKRQVQTLPGYSDRQTIHQAVNDALRASKK